jgi:hypothetical protein
MEDETKEKNISEEKLFRISSVMFENLKGGNGNG